MRYRAASPDCLIMVQLDSLWAIYHRSSGLTHVVTDAMVAILGAVQDATATVEGIASAIGERGAVEAVRSHIADLAEAGLLASE